MAFTNLQKNGRKRMDPLRSCGCNPSLGELCDKCIVEVKMATGKKLLDNLRAVCEAMGLDTRTLQDRDDCAVKAAQALLQLTIRVIEERDAAIADCTSLSRSWGIALNEKTILEKRIQKLEAEGENQFISLYPR